MKILKTLLYLLLVVVLVLVLLGFAGPKTYDVSRQVEIQAPKVVVMPYIKSLKKQNAWGPWGKEDPDMEVVYEGEEGQVGSSSAWKSDKVGSGRQEVTSINGNTVETKLTFYMPWGESSSTGYMHAADAEQGTEVTWGFRGENDFIGRIFGVFMNMDKSVGPMFTQGLDTLKAMVERDLSSAYQGYHVQVTEWPGKQYCAARATVPMDEMEAFFGASFGRIYPGVQAAGGQVVGPASGLYYTWDETNKQTDMAAAVPVSGPVQVAQTEMISVPADVALLIDYYGNYDGLGAPHEAMDAFIKKTGVDSKSPVIEEYLTDPTTEPDTTKWLTKIYYLLNQ